MCVHQTGTEYDNVQWQEESQVTLNTVENIDNFINDILHGSSIQFHRVARVFMAMLFRMGFGDRGGVDLETPQLEADGPVRASSRVLLR